MVVGCTPPCHPATYHPIPHPGYTVPAHTRTTSATLPAVDRGQMTHWAQPMTESSGEITLADRRGSGCLPERSILAG